MIGKGLLKIVKNQAIFAPNLFDGKCAIITGGGTGIGFVIAEFLGELGAEVILVSRTEDTLRKAVNVLKRKEIKANYITANIRNENDVTKLIETLVRQHKTIDYLINNAGGQFAAPALDISANGFRSVVD